MKKEYDFSKGVRGKFYNADAEFNHINYAEPKTFSVMTKTNEMSLKKEDKENIEWSESIASLIVDALVDAEIVKLEKFDIAAEIAAEEILVRLSMGDYPHGSKSSSSDKQ